MKLESHLNYEGQNSEIVATYILKELGYRIIYSHGLEDRKMNTRLDYVSFRDKKIEEHYRKIGGYTGDILCRKGNQNYVFDVKLKFFKEGKNMNVFYVTDNEVLDYDQLMKSGKALVKILINLKKNDVYYYGIFDWSDFTYPKNYDPHKSRKTTIRLEDGLDISKLTKFENVKNYKFEQYLDISKIKKVTYFHNLKVSRRELSKKLGRNEGGITSILRKLRLVEFKN